MQFIHTLEAWFIYILVFNLWEMYQNNSISSFTIIHFSLAHILCKNSKVKQKTIQFLCEILDVILCHSKSLPYFSGPLMVCLTLVFLFCPLFHVPYLTLQSSDNSYLSEHSFLVYFCLWTHTISSVILKTIVWLLMYDDLMVRLGQPIAIICDALITTMLSRIYELHYIAWQRFKVTTIYYYFQGCRFKLRKFAWSIEPILYIFHWMNLQFSEYKMAFDNFPSKWMDHIEDTGELIFVLVVQSEVF